MAGDVRPPGDTTVKTRYVDRRYRYRIQTNKPGDPSIAPWGVWNTVSTLNFRSDRPTYMKGVVIQLPGGTSFRKSTPYTHQSIELTPKSFVYEGSYWSQKDMIAWTNRAAQDEGRDLGNLVSEGTRLSPVGILQDARNEAVTKALNKIGDQKVNLGENLATLGQTVRLFTSKAQLLHDALRYAYRVRSWRKLLNKSFRDLKREGIENVTAREYLAYIYGLKPLMNDVYTLAELAKSQGAKTLLFKGVGKATRMSPIRPKSRNFSYSSVRTTSGSYIQKVKCTVWGRIDPNWQGLRSLNQLGLLNPLALAWELVPFSFVVDWFLPIGPVLNALSAPAGLIFVDGSISGRTSETQLMEYRAYTTGYDFLGNTKDPSKSESLLYVHWILEGYKRDVLASWPLPGLWFDQDPFRMDRPLKALALSILALRDLRINIR